MTTAPADQPQPSYPPRHIPPPRRRYNPWLVRIPVLFISGGILVAVVLTIFLIAFELRYMDKITPGVSVFGVDLSGLTRDEATQMLLPRFTYGDEAVFTFRDGDRFWQMTAGELGVSFNAEETVEQAFISGHSGYFLNDLMTQAGSWLNGHSIAPVVDYDQSVAIARLEEIAAEINRPPINATLSLSGATVTATDGQTGRMLDVGVTLAQIDRALTNMETGAELPLVVHETPPVVWNVDEAAQRARLALSGPVTLVATAPDGAPLGPWSADVNQIAALLSIYLADNGDGTQRYEVDISVEAFQSFLENLAAGLVVSPQDGRFHFDEITRQLEVIQPSVSGRTLNVEETLLRLEEGVFTEGNRTVPVAFTYVEPRYHNAVTAAELGISELVSETTTYFTGSTVNRRTNIAVAASRFDGIIIPPGEEFSFNYWLGPVEYEFGFVDGKVIFNTGTVTGIGGGVCQVSTTAFRAAFSGGFSIIERNTHGYRVGYYEQNNSDPGLDASIWHPDRDFRFQNDTPYHLLIETSLYPTQHALQFRFYSTNPGRRAVIEEALIQNVAAPLPLRYVSNHELQPGQSRQVEWAAEGADVTVYRNIYDLSGNMIREDLVFTHYEPWGPVIEVAPNDERLNQDS